MITTIVPMCKPSVGRKFAGEDCFMCRECSETIRSTVNYPEPTNTARNHLCRHSTCAIHAYVGSIVVSDHTVPHIVCNSLRFNVPTPSASPLLISSIAISNNKHVRLASNTTTYGTAECQSIMTFLSEHLLTWISYNPGVSTIGINLSARLRGRFETITIEPNEFLVSINKALSHDAIVLHGNWQIFIAIFTDTKELDNNMLFERSRLLEHHSHLPVLSPPTRVCWIDFHYSEVMPLPLPIELPTSVKYLLQGIELLESRGLQLFIALRPIDYKHLSDTFVDVSVLQKRLKHWSLAASTLYAPNSKMVLQHRDCYWSDVIDIVVTILSTDL